MARLGTICLSILALVAEVLADPTTSPALSRMFDRFDRDRDGKLASAEWQPLARGADRLLDADGNGAIDRAEFARSFLSVHGREATNRSLLYGRDVREAEGLLANGYTRQALERARDAAARFPESGHAWGTLARAHEKLGHDEEARKAYEKAAAATPVSEKALVARAIFLARHGSAAEASAALQAALESLEKRFALFGGGPNDAQERDLFEQSILGIVDHFAREKPDPKRADELLRWAQDRLGRRPRLESTRLEILLARGERERALEEARRLEREGYAVFWMIAFQARALAEAGRTDEARERFRQALRRGEATPAEEQQAELDLFLALARGGRAEAADRVLRDRILPATTTPASRRRLARYLADAGRRELAREQLEAALRASPGDPALESELARLRR